MSHPQVFTYNRRSPNIACKNGQNRDHLKEADVHNVEMQDCCWNSRLRYWMF